MMERCAGIRGRAGFIAVALRRAAGFTLIELMIVVAVIAILAAIAYPSYTRYVVKTRRTAAEGCLLQAAQYLERYHATYLSYSADGKTGQPAPTLPACEADVTAHYAIALASAAATYTVTATAKQGDTQASADAACAALSVDQTGAQSPATCW